MGKKTRRVKLTVFGSVEGKREKSLLDVLVEIYMPRDNNINPSFADPKGGKPDNIVKHALTECHRDRSFAWFDQDFEPEETLSADVRVELAKSWNIPVTEDFLQCATSILQERYNPTRRKPVLIVSKPLNVDALILSLLGYTLPFTEVNQQEKAKHKADLKASLGGKIGSEDETEFFRKNLSLEICEEKRALIPELDLLISMITI